MIELTPDEARVIAVLVEKELTTPEQYPLTINGIVNGANQKNNRDPVCTMDDLQVRSALVGLRNKAMVVQQDAPGQRASKFRHKFMEAASINKPEMVVLAELLLRGPQTLGELRGHCSRMHPMDSLELVRSVLEQLMNKPEPLVKQIPPSPGSRAERYVQLLCPDLHPVEHAAVTAGVGAGFTAGAAPISTGERLARLEAEVAGLRGALEKLARELGLPDPMSGAGASGQETASTGAAHHAPQASVQHSGESATQALNPE